MADLHLEKPTQKEADVMEKTKIFWFPTDNTSGHWGNEHGRRPAINFGRIFIRLPDRHLGKSLRLGGQLDFHQ
jgi:hypothetical protein